MAHHKAVTRQSWQASQKIELCRWLDKAHLDQSMQYLQSAYVPLLQRYTSDLPDEAQILEIGCGPTCISRLIDKGHKTYADPLLDDYRRAYPGELPDGTFLSAMAESIPRPDRHFDCMICVNTLGFLLNPELALSEADRLLKPGGTMLIGMTIFSPLRSRLHYLIQRCLPSLCPEDRPYCYSLAGIRKTLERHFTIVADIRVGRRKVLLPFLRNEERFFVCRMQAASG